MDTSGTKARDNKVYYATRLQYEFKWGTVDTTKSGLDGEAIPGHCFSARALIYQNQHLCREKGFGLWPWQKSRGVKLPTKDPLSLASLAVHDLLFHC